MCYLRRDIFTTLALYLWNLVINSILSSLQILIHLIQITSLRSSNGIIPILPQIDFIENLGDPLKVTKAGSSRARIGAHTIPLYHPWSNPAACAAGVGMTTFNISYIFLEEVSYKKLSSDDLSCWSFFGLDSCFLSKDESEF